MKKCNEEFKYKMLIKSSLLDCNIESVLKYFEEDYDKFLLYSRSLLKKEIGFFLFFPDAIDNLINILNRGSKIFRSEVNLVLRDINSLKVIDDEERYSHSELFYSKQVIARGGRFISIEKLQEEIIVDKKVHDMIFLEEEGNIDKNSFIKSINYFMNEENDIFDGSSISRTKELLRGNFLENLFLLGDKISIYTKFNKLDRGSNGEKVC